MKPSRVSLALCVLLTACSATGSQTGSALYPDEPNPLDGEGLFLLDAKLVREQRVRRVSTSDWLYGEGGLQERGRVATLEFDSQGRLVRYSGRIENGQPAEIESSYDGALLLEQRFFKGIGPAREHTGTTRYQHPDPRTELRELIDPEGHVFMRKRVERNEQGRPVRLAFSEGEAGEFTPVVEWHHDDLGNLRDLLEPERLTTYSFDGSTLTVRLYSGNRPTTEGLQETRQYTFDERGLLLSFRRESPDGSFWDRFDYRLDEAGLPIEKTWSRLAYVLQEPYEVTRYRYERFD